MVTGWFTVINDLILVFRSHCVYIFIDFAAELGFELYKVTFIKCTDFVKPPYENSKVIDNIGDNVGDNFDNANPGHGGADAGHGGNGL